MYIDWYKIKIRHRKIKKLCKFVSKMAPFKLKFRMGSSRSTSQEVDPDPQVNEALLNHSSTTIGASNSTIDSADCTSLGSIGNEKRSLLPNKTNNLRLGYLNPAVTQCTSENSIPKSPPPSYEHVLEENTRLANNLDLDGSCLTFSTEDSVGIGEQTTNSNLSSINNIQNQSNNSSENISFGNITNPCTDPDCSITNETQNLEHHNSDNNDDGNDNNRKKSIDSTEYLISTMTTPSSQENLLDDECDGTNTNCSRNSDNHNNRRDNNSDYDDNNEDGTQNQPPPDYSSQNGDNQQSDDNESDDDWDSNQQSQMSSNTYQQEEIISNKSSKEIYKAISKQWGITCKMSDQCRCMECQSNYFDCEYDDNEHQKTDGGLGAGTPMFISEVMQGSACTIL